MTTPTQIRQAIAEIPADLDPLAKAREIQAFVRPILRIDDTAVRGDLARELADALGVNHRVVFAELEWTMKIRRQR
jgi:hypothetical protein